MQKFIGRAELMSVGYEWIGSTPIPYHSMIPFVVYSVRKNTGSHFTQIIAIQRRFGTVGIDTRLLFGGFIICLITHFGQKFLFTISKTVLSLIDNQTIHIINNNFSLSG